MLTYNESDGLLMYGQRILCEVGYADEHFPFVVKAFNDLVHSTTHLLAQHIWDESPIKFEHSNEYRDLLLKLNEIAVSNE